MALTESPRTRPESSRQCSQCGTVAPPRKRICAACGGAIVTVAAANAAPAPDPGAEPAQEPWLDKLDAIAPPDSLAPPAGGCRACGATPTADVKFRSNTGMVFKWQMKTYDGPWCRDCGKAIYRTAMNHTLLAGWWGVISFFANLFFIGQNLVALAKLRGLGEPQRAPGQAFLPPGKPLYQRPGIFVGLLVVTVVGFFGIGYLSADTPEEALEKLPGKCVTFKAADAGQRRISDTVDCSQPHDGKILGIRDGDVNDFLGGGPSLDRCPAGTTTIFTLKNEDSLVGKYICVNEDG